MSVCPFWIVSDGSRCTTCDGFDSVGCEYHPPYWSAVEDVGVRQQDVDRWAALVSPNPMVCIVCGWGGCKRSLCGRYDFRHIIHAYGFIRNYGGHHAKFSGWLGDQVAESLRGKGYDVSVVGLEKWFRARNIRGGSSTDAIVVDYLVSRFVAENPC